MPLELGKHKGLIETIFWIFVIAIAYFAMIQLMHPGGKII